jgi:hypothetical protein
LWGVQEGEFGADFVLRAERRERAGESRENGKATRNEAREKETRNKTISSHPLTISPLNPQKLTKSFLTTSISLFNSSCSLAYSLPSGFCCLFSPFSAFSAFSGFPAAAEAGEGLRDPVGGGIVGFLIEEWEGGWEEGEGVLCAGELRGANRLGGGLPNLHVTFGPITALVVGYLSPFIDSSSFRRARLRNHTPRESAKEQQTSGWS